MKQSLTILTLTLLFSCSIQPDTKEEVYYIVKHPERFKPLEEDAPPPPQITFYGQYNFILLDSSKVFFHSNHIFSFCGTGIDASKPPKVFLAPDSLTEIKINELQSFLSSSITNSIANDRNFFASISSPADTIKNRAFKIITDFFKSKEMSRYNIRNWTEEEKYVTIAKLENKNYNPDTIEWEIGFDFEEGLQTDTITDK